MSTASPEWIWLSAKVLWFLVQTIGVSGMTITVTGDTVRVTRPSGRAGAAVGPAVTTSTVLQVVRSDEAQFTAWMLAITPLIELAAMLRPRFAFARANRARESGATCGRGTCRIQCQIACAAAPPPRGCVRRSAV